MLQYLHISKIICNFAGENTLPPYDVKLGEKEYMKQFITSLLAVTGVEEVESQIHRAKILRDGQIFILRGDKTYTITGAEVK